MSTALAAPPVRFTDSDGEHMAVNTLQFQWITTLQGNLDLIFMTGPTFWSRATTFGIPTGTILT
jgi:hypothetical protein